MLFEETFEKFCHGAVVPAGEAVFDTQLVSACAAGFDSAVDLNELRIACVDFHDPVTAQNGMGVIGEEHSSSAPLPVYEVMTPGNMGIVVEVACFFVGKFVQIGDVIVVVFRDIIDGARPQIGDIVAEKGAVNERPVLHIP